jgi:hypothetical protein
MSSRAIAAHRSRATGVRRAAPVVACALVCGILILVRAQPGLMPFLTRDSFEYLSMARNALQGHLGYSSIIHFDAERSFGVVPAPVVTYPAGYPLLIALVSALGVPVDTAAVLVGLVSTVACIPILAWLADRLGISSGVKALLLGAFAINALVTKYGASAMSEALFTLLVLAGAALLVKASLDSGRGWSAAWLAAGLAFGAASFVRYAGLFFVAALALLMARHLLARRGPLARGYASALVVAGAAALVESARSLLLVGNLQGGAETVVHRALVPVLAETAQAINAAFVYGPGFVSDFGTLIERVLFLGLFYLGILLLAAGAFRGWALASRSALAGANDVIDLALLALAYGAGVFYAGLTSWVTYGVRLFVPVIPLLLLLLGFALDRLLAAVPRAAPVRRASAVLLLASLVPYVALNLAGLRDPSPVDGAAVAAAFDVPDAGGRSARAVIREIAGPDGVIIANDGQAVGYELQTLTVSLVGPDFSLLTWDDGTLRATVERFHVAAVVISTGIPTGLENGEDDLPSPLIQALAAGQSPPWLTLAYRSGTILVYVPASQKA